MTKEGKKEYQKKWRKNNPEKSKEYHQKYRVKILKYKKEYYKENKEKIKEYNQKNKARFKERIKKWSREWREKNPERFLKYAKRQREVYNPQKRREDFLKKKANNKCPECKKGMSPNAKKCRCCFTILRKQRIIIIGKQFVKGSQHPNWKGGITPLLIKIRMSFEYKQWRSDVFEKDNYICQKCEEKNSNDNRLEAHHIKSFSKIIEENKIKTFEEAINCKKLWDINNGIIYCQKCHKLTDNYGYRKIVAKRGVKKTCI